MGNNNSHSGWECFFLAPNQKRWLFWEKVNSTKTIRRDRRGSTLPPSNLPFVSVSTRMKLLRHRGFCGSFHRAHFAFWGKKVANSRHVHQPIETDHNLLVSYEFEFKQLSGGGGGGGMKKCKNKVLGLQIFKYISIRGE